MIKAVIFDIGETLVTYSKPLNWVDSYIPALYHAASGCKLQLTDHDYYKAAEILKKYNTRLHPRQKEVSSYTIFKEILSIWHIDSNYLYSLKDTFYQYFCKEASVFDDVKITLEYLRQQGIQTATLSHVPYGMDNKFVLSDIAEIINYIDFPLTSNDVGFRKPGMKGLNMLRKKMGISEQEMLFVGDEKKDVECANAVSVLLDRRRISPDYGQKYTIDSLLKICEIIKDV